MPYFMHLYIQYLHISSIYIYATVLYDIYKIHKYKMFHETGATVSTFIHLGKTDSFQPGLRQDTRRIHAPHSCTIAV